MARTDGGPGKGKPDGTSSSLTEKSQKDILNALPLAMLMVDEADGIGFANAAAESLFGLGEDSLCRMTIADLFGGADNAIAPLLSRIRAGSGVVVARELSLTGHLAGMLADVQAAHIADRSGAVLLVFEERRLPGVLQRRSNLEGAARTVFGLSGMLAHEIKNPLSGIRGAAQLLEKQSSGSGKDMAILIREEVDRIHRLVDQLENFTDVRPFTRRPVNIHTILSHVRDVACSGFAKHIRIVEHYDPSLPPVFGERDRLVQIFLNLVKNAAEAVPEKGGEIHLVTAYRHGLRMPMAEGGIVDLPVEVTVADNGPGINTDLKEHIFEPFVTDRDGGSGLGLAMVAKLVAELGGIVELDAGMEKQVAGGGGARFTLLFAAATGAEGEDNA